MIPGATHRNWYARYRLEDKSEILLPIVAFVPGEEGPLIATVVQPGSGFGLPATALGGFVGLETDEAEDEEEDQEA